ncbi:energy-converting hydrogenase A subunit M [Parabacteroides sp. PH5-13]|uniref:hypothetical protein n=1 Tax=unclassified Parabacteroides TaxID=2649774 RepID=UPI00247720DA|nr:MULTISPECIES: hypothetical protein [unclassified Parabacteroides]MDH6304281.1 energy-converting hydrogenase A subunit M [Parabacteroides sp. PH5-39]MDH6318664.1 energy-converting hydrogenase A subunit M [Parabacteroides sp. PH5-13]MDH6322394.1 energy-converting hydrogenase A subunit M [Parabacteroides sp. PH5-8]MDH6383781.1 energy-converting hydrogenase A subunit M [Parabacteroides sp. PH5-17]MDH6392885.1 energy-converting hydrogenase A subunit M [Parabacteroides sp. PFB2-22]
MSNPDEDFVLPVEEIPINKGEWLSDALKRAGYENIPTMVFLNKVEPGRGATHGELIAKRNSIIIEPPVPAIVGKTENNPNYLGVYEKATKKDVEWYFNRTDIEFKKIVATPEGYVKKVLPIAKKLNIDLHKDYFCLYDECDKLIEDTGYRPAISIPINDFFAYAGKAYVSATPIQPRSPIFKEHGFRWLEVKPTYDYKKDATLIVTRSINRTIKAEIQRLLADSNPICVFYKTTKGINKLLTWLLDNGIIKESEYKVFCSQKSVKLLKGVRFKNSYEQINLPLAKINFFTSRFFTAFDLWVTKRCNILVLSNFGEVAHSIIDPFTEAVQIQGRFRKVFKDGKRYNSLTFITNVNDKLRVKTEEEVTQEIEANKEQYMSIKGLYKNEINKRKKAIHKKQLKKMDYALLMDADGGIDPFKVDNRYNEERVKSYYIDQYRLKQAYEDTGHFNLTFIPEELLGEDDKLAMSKAKQKDRWKLIVEHIERMQKAKLRDESFDLESTIEFIRSSYPDDEFIIDAYFKIGRPRIEASEWKKRAIEAELKAYDLQESQKLRFSPEVVKDIEEEFRHEIETQSYVSKTDFRDRLKMIYRAHGITFKEYGDGQKGINVMSTITDDTVYDYFIASLNNNEKPPSYRLKGLKPGLV